MTWRRSISLVASAFACACGSPTDTSHDRAANATYSGIIDEPITLTDSVWRGPPYDDGGASRPVVRLLDAPFASGDIDGDGVDELAVILVASFGGSGAYTYIALVDSLDDESFAIGTRMMGDRIVVESIGIDGDVIRANTLEHAADDAMCCPTLGRSREWSYANNSLVEGSVDAAARSLRGHVTIGHEVRTFVQCDSAREGWILDMTQGDLTAIYTKLAGEQYQPLYVEVTGTWRSPPETGFGADFEEAVAIDTVVRAEREGFGCLDEPSTYSYRASGNEPSWRLDIAGDKVSLTRTSGDVIRSITSTLRTDSGSLTISAGDLVATITESRCEDSMSGSIFALTAELDVGGEVLDGCAVEGQLPLDEVERQSDRQAQ